MSLELITYSGDRMLVLGNAEAVRKPVYGSTWNTIRIGLRGFLDDFTANLLSPVMAFGVCSGSANPYGAASSTNVCGVRLVNTSGGAINYNAGGGFPYGSQSNCQWTPFKRVATTITDGTAFGIGAPALFGTDTAGRRQMLILDIVKGSPNYTFYLAGWTNSGTHADISDAQFEAAMDLPAPLTALGIGGAANAGYDMPGSQTLAVDQVAGNFDNIFIYWNRAAVKNAFDIKHRMIS